ncbi:MAG: proton-conducting transporter membrane subunit [Isosphaeraceae bacterium]
MSTDALLTGLGLVVIVVPVSLALLMGLTSLLDRVLTESRTTQLLQWGTVTGLAASLGVLALMLGTGSRHVAIALGDWVVVPGLYHFSLKLVFDRLSVPMAILSFTLVGVIGAFGSRYLHRERGFNRFFTLYSLFLLGMVMASLAGTIETLFTGWELVGLSSALLVAYYQDRPAPARNGLWVWSVYRVSDAALLLAAVALHHLRGEGDFDRLMGSGSWPESHAALASGQALGVGLSFLLAAAGKSALVPFSGWLPRAMEGPTPSSAVFYGALSVHLGAFLLLRLGPLLECSRWLQAAVVVVGLTTSALAYLVGSVQTDVKSSLSFASLSQVGLIVAEIGLGFRYLALVHLLGHACMRTLQFLRAPTLLQDYHTLENAIGDHLPRGSTPWERLSAGPKAWLYRFALERGYLDAILREYVAGPITRTLLWCDAAERRWTDFLSGGESRESDRVLPHFETIDEVL